MALIDNADIASIAERGEQTRILAWTDESWGPELSLPDDLLEPLAEKFGGYGGGHSDAGIANFKCNDVTATETAVVNDFESALGIQFEILS